jgi:hypothetical protein
MGLATNADERRIPSGVVQRFPAFSPNLRRSQLSEITVGICSKDRRIELRRYRSARLAAVTARETGRCGKDGVSTRIMADVKPTRIRVGELTLALPCASKNSPNSEAATANTQNGQRNTTESALNPPDDVDLISTV